MSGQTFCWLVVAALAVFWVGSMLVDVVRDLRGRRGGAG